MKKKFKGKDVRIQGMYNLDGDYILFKDNPHHGKVFTSVDVSVGTKVEKYAFGDYVVDVVKIDGYEPIECELVEIREHGDNLLICICNDWG